MPESIGCFDRDCICNQPERKDCPTCDGEGRVYTPFLSECCMAEPVGQLVVIMEYDAGGPVISGSENVRGVCSKCGNSEEFSRDRETCGTCKGEGWVNAGAENG